MRACPPSGYKTQGVPTLNPIAKARPIMKALLCWLALGAAVPLSAQSTVDTSGVGALVDQAMNRSEVMQNLQHLGDVIGPRLSGSAAMRQANDWTAERFRAYGLSAALEPYVFGVPWERGTASLRLVAPFSRAVTAHSWAWTEGTRGEDTGGSGGTGRPVDAGKPRGVSRQGEGCLGASPVAIPDLEPGRAGHDGGRLDPAPRRACAPLPGHRGHVGAGGRRAPAIPARSALRAQGRRRARHPVRWSEGARAHDHERLAHPGRAAAQSGRLARGLRAACPAHRRWSDAPPGGQSGQPPGSDSGAAVEYGGRDSGEPSGPARWSSWVPTSTAGTWVPA